MKKTLALLLTGILALSLALAGCSSSTSKEKDDGKGGSSEVKGGDSYTVKAEMLSVLTQLS